MASAYDTWVADRVQSLRIKMRLWRRGVACVRGKAGAALLHARVVRHLRRAHLTQHAWRSNGLRRYGAALACTALAPRRSRRANTLHWRAGAARARLRLVDIARRPHDCCMPDNQRAVAANLDGRALGRACKLQ